MISYDEKRKLQSTNAYQSKNLNQIIRRRRDGPQVGEERRRQERLRESWEWVSFFSFGNLFSTI